MTPGYTGTCGCQHEAEKCLPHMLRLSGKFLNWTTTLKHPCMRPDQPWTGPNKPATPPRCWVGRGPSALGSAGHVTATLSTLQYGLQPLCLRLVVKQPRERDKYSIMRNFWYYRPSLHLCLRNVYISRHVFTGVMFIRHPFLHSPEMKPNKKERGRKKKKRVERNRPKTQPDPNRSCQTVP